MSGSGRIWKSLYLTDFPRDWGLEALLVELWKQGLFQRLVRGVSLWGSCGGREVDAQGWLHGCVPSSLPGPHAVKFTASPPYNS